MNKTIIGLIAIVFILLITGPAYSGVGFGGAFRDNTGVTSTVRDHTGTPGAEMEEMHDKMCSEQFSPETQKEMCAMMKDVCGMMNTKKVNPPESNSDKDIGHKL